MTNIKQVIIIRTDLRNKSGQKLRTGKLISQGAHASVNALLSGHNIYPTGCGAPEDYPYKNQLNLELDDEMHEWITGGVFKKITLGCGSEEELLEIYAAAQFSRLRVAIIKDNALTELIKPTFTAVAIGPADGDLIDVITGGLSLF